LHSSGDPWHSLQAVPQKPARFEVGYTPIACHVDSYAPQQIIHARTLIDDPTEGLTHDFGRSPRAPARWLRAFQSRSIAAFNPSSTSRSDSDDRVPSLLVSLARSRVVTWWHIAKLVFGKLADRPGSSTTVGPRLACDEDVEIGTTIMDFHPGVWLKPS